MCSGGCNNPGNPSGGGGSGGPTTGTPGSSCTITSETVSTARINRQRTRIGVGEQVTLTATPSASYTWSVVGGGTLSSTSGDSVVFTAGDRASTSTITARRNGCTCIARFTVVEPSGAHQVQHDGTLHESGTASAGFMGITYLEPRDVSFENIEVIEGECPATATGIRAGDNGKMHPRWPSRASVAGGTDATGSMVEGPNNSGGVYWDFVFTNVGALRGNGTFEWNIPWLFRVNGGAEKEFTRLLHRAVYEPSGRVTMSKGGVSVSAVPSDARNMP